MHRKSEEKQVPAVLVTGGAKRIGKAICTALAGAGYNVAIHYNASAEPARALAEVLAQHGIKTAVVQADLANEAAVNALVAAAAQALGEDLTALVNNASLFEWDSWDTADTELWHRHHMVNLRAPYLLSRAFAQQAKARDNPAIINIIDQRVRRLNPQFFSYTLSKASLWTMTQTLAQALAPDIRVNGVGPGPVLQSIHQDSSIFENEAANTPLAQSVEPQEIAQACLYLLEARKVTGQMIAVDSGQHLAWRTPDVGGDHHG
ncbi:MAG: SDR family oxidoreductase [Pseudomonadota bacterium]